jgi:hypothetical protein
VKEDGESTKLYTRAFYIINSHHYYIIILIRLQIIEKRDEN